MNEHKNDLRGLSARQILLAWLKLLALDGDLARAEPKTLRPVN